MKLIKPLDRWTKTLNITLIIYINVTALFSILSIHNLTDGLDPIRGHIFEKLSIAQWVITKIAFIFWYVWLVRAVKNTRILHGASSAPKPFWAVLAYLIPIVNFFVPYKHLRRVLKSNHVQPEKYSKLTTNWFIPGLIGIIFTGISNIILIYFPELGYRPVDATDIIAFIGFMSAAQVTRQILAPAITEAQGDQVFKKSR